VLCLPDGTSANGLIYVGHRVVFGPNKRQEVWMLFQQSKSWFRDCSPEWLSVSTFQTNTCVCTRDLARGFRVPSQLSLFVSLPKQKYSVSMPKSVACTINVYDRRFYDRKLRSSLERKLRPYDRNPSYG